MPIVCSHHGSLSVPQYRCPVEEELHIILLAFVQWDAGFHIDTTPPHQRNQLDFVGLDPCSYVPSFLQSSLHAYVQKFLVPSLCLSVSLGRRGLRQHTIQSFTRGVQEGGGGPESGGRILPRCPQHRSKVRAA